MGKTKIEWADYTWNPLTGCEHKCEYCYARTFSKRFSGDINYNISQKKKFKYEDKMFILDKPFKYDDRVISFPFGFIPTYHKYRLNDPASWKSGQNIFVGSMTDMFGEWVPDRILKDIFSVAETNCQHNYLFLTKNPHRYDALSKSGVLPSKDNFWYGFSVDKIGSKGVSLDEHTFISFEPLLEDIGSILIDEKVKLCDWAIIGAETGNQSYKVVPQKEWVDNIVTYCEKFNIPVFMKDSLIDIVGEENMRREFPPELQWHEISENNKKRWVTVCAECKKTYPKKEMTAILERGARGESAKALGYICNNCIDNFRKRFRNGNTNDS